MTNSLIDELAAANGSAAVRKILSQNGIDPHQFESPSPEQYTFNEHFRRYRNRRRSLSNRTHMQYNRTLLPFIEFLNGVGVEYPAQLLPGHIEQYVDHLFDEHDADATILTHTKNIRAWLAWLEPCKESIYTLLDRERLDLNPNARDEAPEPETMVGILDALETKRRATPIRAVLELAWSTGLRLGELRALDYEDIEFTDCVITLIDRRETGTRLKNGHDDDGQRGDSERIVETNRQTMTALQRYTARRETPVVDEYGRRPLFYTDSGRADTSTLRRWVYRATSCRWASDYIDEMTCDGDCDPDSNPCPYSFYPHAIRRGAITDQLSNGLGYTEASERFDVSIPTLKSVYDVRTKQHKHDDRKADVQDSMPTR